MKRKRHHDPTNNFNKSENKKSKSTTAQPLNNNGTTEFLKLALERVCALQAELSRESDKDDEQVDAETAGYAACAIETFRFLASEGLTADDLLVQRLSEHLLNKNTTDPLSRPK